MTDKKILLGLTTTRNSNWIDKVREIEEFQISEAALFLTGINKEDREKLYSLLEKTPLKSAPHIHLRNDMKKDEVSYLVDRYGTTLLNIHSKREFDFDPEELKSFRDKIYIENTHVVPTQNELDNYAGLCLDFTHWEVFRKKENYRELKDLAQKNKIGCCHISAVKSFFGFFGDDSHWADKEKDFNYILKYVDYLPEIMSLELENSFKEQMKFKKYIERILNINN